MSAPKYNAKTLPKWAQQEIETLEMRLRDARNTIAELTNSEPTRVELEPRGGPTERPMNYLPDRSRIRFAMADETRAWRDFLDVQLNGDRVEVYGSDTLEIVPWSTNIIHLRLRDKP